MSEPEFFSKCGTQAEQVAWIRSRMLPCPFCGGGGENLVVHLPDRTGYAEVGCLDFACCQPRACKKYLRDCLEQWNMRPRTTPEPR